MGTGSLFEGWPQNAEAAQAQVQATLPRCAEFFVSDPHGEYEELSHIVRTGSGALRALVDEALPGLTQAERAQLVTLVAYPEEKLPLLLAPFEQGQVPEVTPVATGGAPQNENEFLAELLGRLVVLAQRAGEGRPHSQVVSQRPGLPEILRDLLAAPTIHGIMAKAEGAYAPAAVDALVATGAAPAAVCELAYLIQRLIMPHLHLVGDIFDRGPAPDKIMDALIRLYEQPGHPVDIQWGNHDIVWMGAACGQRGCIAHVVRNCARYGNLDILTQGYGLDLQPLYDFALAAYAEDPCVAFGLKVNPGLSPEELDLNIKVQKAMAILQFKVEAQLIDENPSFGLEKRKLLHRIDWAAGTVEVDGAVWPLADTVFPTVDPADPCRLTTGEEAVMQSLVEAFQKSEKLQRHVRFLLEAGSLYKIVGDDLLLHACVPLNPDGSLMEVGLFGKVYKGRALYDALQEMVMLGFSAEDQELRRRGRDIMWYLWLGEGSPLFAKSKMATFEIYLIADKAARKEEKNAFYKLFDRVEPYEGIFRDFGLDPARAHLVCGHVPVKVKDGEDPVRADGRVICIDGGMSAAYQKTTGIAGFTLVRRRDGLTLYAHRPFAGRAAAIQKDAALESVSRDIS